MTALAGFVAYDRESRRVCSTWSGPSDADARDPWLRWCSHHLDHGCAISNVLSTEAFPVAGESWLPEVLL